MPSISFTPSEYAFLHKTAFKLLEARKNLSPKEWQKSQHKAVKDFAKRFDLKISEGEVELQTRILTRNDARLIQELLTKLLEALKASVIPEYEKRINQHPDKADYYRPYLTKAQDTHDTYLSILKKVEAIL